MTIAVIGGGSWGTTLCCLLAPFHDSLKLYTRLPAHAAELKVYRKNNQYLPDITIPSNVQISSEIGEVCNGASTVFLAVPSQAMRDIVSQVHAFVDENSTIVSATKGFELGSGNTMSALIEELCGQQRGNTIAVLSGPNIAYELARKKPGACVIASKSLSTAEHVQDLFARTNLRSYTSTDVAGVEIGGAVKNVIAIAAGICDGLDIGDNGKAAIITRGIAEMARFGKEHGAVASTFAGLSGLGDCIATCMSSHSRNRTLGEYIGTGMSLHDARFAMNGMVAEGITTAQSLVEHFKVTDESMPITYAVYAVLFGNIELLDAFTHLMQRSLGAEYREDYAN